MASWKDRITALVQSPQGRRWVDKAKQTAARPENKERIAQVRRRLQKRR